MFREVTRKKRALPAEECIEILKNEKRGVLSLQGDDGYPYGLPIDYWYCEEDGKIYYHGSKKGHKIDSIRRDNKASFCVCDEGYREEGEWALNIKSVIVFGRMELVTDPAKTIEILHGLGYKFTDDSEYIEKEIRDHEKNVQCLALTPEHITGKLVNES